MAPAQIAVRIPATMLCTLDELVESGAFQSRAAVVRAGIEAIAELEHRRQIDQAIVDGYQQQPPTAAEDAAALAVLREAILEESW